jgi:hypothetical protein
MTGVYVLMFFTLFFLGHEREARSRHPWLFLHSSNCRIKLIFCRIKLISAFVFRRQFPTAA